MKQEFLDSLGLEAETAQAVLEAHNAIVQGYEDRIRDITAEAAFKQAVAAAGGRNYRAIRALLTPDSLGEDPEAGAAMAVAAVKRENPYLFAAPSVTAPGTGGSGMVYSQQELGRMSQAEYRRYRKAANGR